MLEQARDLLSVMTMPVADGEEVAVSKVEHVRVCQVGVLVDFVGVVSRDTSLCCKGELSDTVIKLLLRRLGLGYRLRRGDLSSD